MITKIKLIVELEFDSEGNIDTFAVGDRVGDALQNEANTGGLCITNDDSDDGGFTKSIAIRTMDGNLIRGFEL